VGPRGGLDDLGRRKFLPLPGLKLRPLGRPARSQSLCRLRYRGRKRKSAIWKFAYYVWSTTGAVLIVPSGINPFSTDPAPLVPHFIIAPTQWPWLECAVELLALGDKRDFNASGLTLFLFHTVQSGKLSRYGDLLRAGLPGFDFRQILKGFDDRNLIQVQCSANG
jgi:hypothetical protein